MLIDPEAFGADREQVRLTLEAHNIESRPVWKPMHCQPVFRGYEAIGGGVAESLFAQGLCLPSGTALTNQQLEYIVSIIRDIHHRRDSSKYGNRVTLSVSAPAQSQ